MRRSSYATELRGRSSEASTGKSPRKIRGLAENQKGIGRMVPLFTAARTFFQGQLSFHDAMRQITGA
jgi:hypothetical protein